MKSNNTSHMLITENNSQIEITSTDPHIVLNKLYTKEYLNNLLLDVIHTLDSTRNLIHKIESQNVQPYNQCLKDDINEKEFNKLNHMSKKSTDVDIQTKPTGFKDLTTSKTDQGKKENINSEINKQPYIEKNNNIINDEVSLLIKLVKSIFQKLDDPNYECENESCQLLRDRQKIKMAKITDNHQKEYNQNINNEHQINLNQSNKIVNKENINENITIDKQKNTNFKSIIKTLKVDPKCKENQSFCTCSPIEEYYRQNNCSYINYEGRILVFNCPNDS